MSFGLTSPSHLSFVSVSSFDPYANDVRVTPGARRQRQSNRVQQRVAIYEALEASAGAETARRIQDTLETRGVAALSTADRATLDAAENVVEGEDETASPLRSASPPSADQSTAASEASSLRPGEIASTPVGRSGNSQPGSVGELRIRSAPSGRLVATDRSGSVTLQNASEQFIRRGLSALRSAVNPPPSGPSPYAQRLNQGAPAGSPSPIAAASPPAPDRTDQQATPATPSQDLSTTFRTLDLSSIDSPTLGASTTQLERLAGSIETMADQVKTGMQALSSANTSLKGASPDERVKLLETLQSDPQLQELVRAGLMNWSDLMRPNPAKGSEGHVASVDEGDPVIDPTKLAALQSKLSTAAQRQANDLTRVQQVVERRRTTPGAVPATSGAMFPGLKVWMPPAFAPPVPPGRS